MNSWRPNSASAVPLSDAELAKLGLLAQLEAQGKSAITMSLKSLRHANVVEWRKMEQRQFKKLAEELLKLASPIDAELRNIALKINDAFEDVLARRHQNLHSLWASSSPDEGIVAWDLKRDVQILPRKLDDDLQRVADFTHLCAASSNRVGRLILDGKIPEGTEHGGPHIFLGRWVKF